MTPSYESHSPGQKRALVLRIRKVTGQLRAIEKMIDEDMDCSDVLAQLVSARRGLKSLAQTLIEGHLRECIGHAQDDADAQRKFRQLLVVLERYVE